MRSLAQLMKQLTEKPLPTPTIFVVDDEAEIVDILSEHLEDQGCKVYKFTDSQKVKLHMNSILPDLIISDYTMPGLNGIEMLKQVREHYNFVPGFILISTRSEELKKADIRHLGITAFLDKPIDFSLLNQSIINFYTNTMELRNRYLRATAQIQVQFENLTLNTENIGYGGFFLSFNKEQENIFSSKLYSNEALPFVLHLTKEKPPIYLKGKVAWKRRSQDSKSYTGIGVKFTQIHCQDQMAILELIKLKRLSNPNLNY